MARRDYLFSLAERMEWANIRFILIQIEEAHTDGWPIGRDYQPKNHSCFKDRVDMANQFIQNFNPPFPVYIDEFDMMNQKDYIITRLTNEVRNEYIPEGNNVH